MQPHDTELCWRQSWRPIITQLSLPWTGSQVNVAVASSTYSLAFVVFICAKVMRWGRFACRLFCLSFCPCAELLQRCNQPLSLKLAVDWAYRSKYWLTLGSDPVLDTDSGSLFHFFHHCGIGDWRRFVSISHTVTGRFSRCLEWLTPTMKWIRKVINPQHFGSDPADIRIWIQLIQKSGFESQISFGWG